MIDAMISLLDVAVVHRAIRFQSDFVSGLVNLKPFVRVGFVFANLISHFGVEYFCATTRHAAQSCVSQILQNVFERILGQKLKPVDLNGCPAFEMKLWIGVVKDFDDMTIPVVSALMVQSAYNVHFSASIVDRLLPRARIWSSLMTYPFGSRRSDRNAQNRQR